MGSYSVAMEAGYRPSKNVARALRRRMTPTERFVWKELRSRQMSYYFRRQHVMAGYVLDFYCHRSSVCIELDGAGHELFHSEGDRERDRILEGMGILTLRFRNEEVASSSLRLD